MDKRDRAMLTMPAVALVRLSRSEGCMTLCQHGSPHLSMKTSKPKMRCVGTSPIFCGQGTTMMVGHGKIKQPLEGRNRMGGLDDLLAESNERWSWAMKRAGGVEDLCLGQAVKGYYLHYFPLGFLALLVIGIAGGILLFGTAPADWVNTVSVGLLLAVVGAFVGGLIYNAKKVAPAVRLNSLDVLFRLTDDERKNINHQIEGKAPLDEEHLPVVRAGAVQRRKSMATQIIVMPAYLLMFAVQGASWAGRRDPFGWIWLAVVVIGAVMAIFLVRDFQRTARFLEATAGG